LVQDSQTITETSFNHGSSVMFLVRYFRVLSSPVRAPSPRNLDSRCDSDPSCLKLMSAWIDFGCRIWGHRGVRGLVPGHNARFANAMYSVQPSSSRCSSGSKKTASKAGRQDKHATMNCPSTETKEGFGVGVGVGLDVRFLNNHFVCGPQDHKSKP
jgi:hypothetical protein